MAEYSEMKQSITEIVGKITDARDHVSRGKTLIARAQTILTDLPTDYSTIIADIDQFLVDNPSDEAALGLKAEKDLLVAEYQAFKTTVDALVIAVNS